jgi:hypothetical protein
VGRYGGKSNAFAAEAQRSQSFLNPSAIFAVHILFF